MSLKKRENKQSWYMRDFRLPPPSLALRASLFCDVRWRRLISGYRRIVTPCRSLVLGLLTLEDRTDKLSRNFGNPRRLTPRKNTGLGFSYCRQRVKEQTENHKGSHGALSVSLNWSQSGISRLKLRSTTPESTRSCFPCCTLTILTWQSDSGQMCSSVLERQMY